MKRALLAALVLGGGVLPAVGWAAPSNDAATAEALFTEARELMSQGRYAEACPKLAASQQLDAALGTLLNLADCYERNGQLASAWARFRDLETVAHRSSDAVREKIARDRLAGLQGRVPLLSIVVPADGRPSGLVVTRDGTPLDPAMWGSALPIDPGLHTIESSVDGTRKWATTVDIKPGGGKAVVVVVDLGSAQTPKVPDPATADVRAPRTGGAQRPLALGALGASVAALGVGAYFGIDALSGADRARDAGCVDRACPTPAALDEFQGAQRSADVATVAFAIGLTALATGAVLWLTAPSASPARGAGSRHDVVRLAR